MAMSESIRGNVQDKSVQHIASYVESSIAGYVVDTFILNTFLDAFTLTILLVTFILSHSNGPYEVVNDLIWTCRSITKLYTKLK